MTRTSCRACLGVSTEIAGPRLGAVSLCRGEPLNAGDVRDACYYGACDNDDISGLIYGTAEYIRAAQNLAQQR